MSFSPIHRVVTAHGKDGKAIIASDGPLPTVYELAAAPGMIFHEVWETQGTPAPVDNRPDPTTGARMHSAPSLGTRIRFVDMPPDEDYLGAGHAGMKELFEELNGAQSRTGQDDSHHPAMHRTESIDYGIVIEGEIYLILDDSEVLLRPGSVVVQRGTNHAWSNRSGRPCRMLFIQLDGKYDPAIAAALTRSQNLQVDYQASA